MNAPANARPCLGYASVTDAIIALNGKGVPIEEIAQRVDVPVRNARYILDEAKARRGNDPADASTPAGAERLRAVIEAYWARRGYEVRTRTVEEVRDNRFIGVTPIVSDMVNGLPRRRLRK